MSELETDPKIYSATLAISTILAVVAVKSPLIIGSLMPIDSTICYFK